MNSQTHHGSWIIGGATLIGLGVGFLVLARSPLYFIASLLIGIGAGIVLASLTARKKR